MSVCRRCSPRHMCSFRCPEEMGHPPTREATGVWCGTKTNIPTVVRVAAAKMWIHKFVHRPQAGRMPTTVVSPSVGSWWVWIRVWVSFRWERFARRRFRKVVVLGCHKIPQPRPSLMPLSEMSDRREPEMGRKW